MKKKKPEPDFPLFTRPILEDVTRNNHRGNANSELANEFVHSTKRQMREKIYNYITERGRFGATLHEVCRDLNLKVQTASGRLSEMKKVDADFHVFWNGLKRATPAREGNMSRPASAFVTSPGQLRTSEAAA